MPSVTWNSPAASTATRSASAVIPIIVMLCDDERSIVLPRLIRKFAALISPQPSTHQLPSGSRRAEQVAASPSAIARRKAAATVLLQARAATSLEGTSRRVKDRAIGATLQVGRASGGGRGER